VENGPNFPDDSSGGIDDREGREIVKGGRGLPKGQTNNTPTESLTEYEGKRGEGWATVKIASPQIGTNAGAPSPI